MENKDTDPYKKEIRKRIIVQSCVLLIYLAVLFYLYFLLVEFGSNFIIVLLILIFTFLMFAGPIFKRRKKSLYSRMFPEKYREGSPDDPRFKRQRSPVIGYKEKFKPKTFKSIDFDSEYKKPLLRKCQNCGMLVPRFADKCPVCGKIVKG